MKTAYILMLSVLTFTFSGCIIHHDDDPDCHDGICPEYLGDIGFYWGFELENSYVTESCALAEVARVDIYVHDMYGDLIYQKLDRPCSDEGAIITDFYPDTYELTLVAICPLGVETHEGTWEIDVYEGTNEFGVLDLLYLAPCE